MSGAYANRFPQHRDFWSRLADEEEQHANWLRRLIVRVEEGLGCVRPDRLTGRRLKVQAAGVCDRIAAKADEMLEKKRA